MHFKLIVSAVSHVSQSDMFGPSLTPSKGRTPHPRVPLQQTTKRPFVIGSTEPQNLTISMGLSPRVITWYSHRQTMAVEKSPKNSPVSSKASAHASNPTCGSPPLNYTCMFWMKTLMSPYRWWTAQACTKPANVTHNTLWLYPSPLKRWHVAVLCRQYA